MCGTKAEKMGPGTQYTGFWRRNTRNLAIRGALDRPQRRASLDR
jgi:hypothetical protein